MASPALRVDPVLLALSRRSTRLATDGSLAIDMPEVKVDIELRDLSFGGFSIAASRPFWRGMTHWFTLSTRSGESIRLVAKAVYCRGADEGRFVSGWEFMRGTADDTEAAIGQLLDALATSRGPRRLDTPY
jgi:hypothetical protein